MCWIIRVVLVEILSCNSVVSSFWCPAFSSNQSLLSKYCLVFSSSVSNRNRDLRQQLGDSGRLVTRRGTYSRGSRWGLVRVGPHRIPAKTRFHRMTSARRRLSIRAKLQPPTSLGRQRFVASTVSCYRIPAASLCPERPTAVSFQRGSSGPSRSEPKRPPSHQLRPSFPPPFPRRAVCADSPTRTYLSLPTHE